MDFLDMVEKKLEDFDNKPRWVIRGKKGTKYEGKGYGFGITTIDPNNEQTFVFDDKFFAEENLQELYRRAVNDDVFDCFEVHEIGKEELYAKYRKSPII